MCGCGRTSVLRGTPAGMSSGPMWSKNTNGPTLRRLANGSTRPTSKPPRSRCRASISISIIAALLGLPVALDQAQRHHGGVLHPADDDTAFDVGDQAERQQPVAQE